MYTLNFLILNAKFSSVGTQTRSQRRPLGTGPEKVRLFTKIDISTLFPELTKRNELKVLWDELIKIIGKPEM